MNIYQIKYDDDHEYCDDAPFLVTHEKQFTKAQLQNIIASARFDMGHFNSYEELPHYLEKYGFKQIVTAYYEE